MKKTFAFLLALVIAMGMFVSYGAASAEGEPVTITFMGWEASPLETESVMNGIALFESENPGIKVEYSPINGDYAQKLLTMMAGDAAPDTFFCGAAEYRSFQQKGVLMDLTDRFHAELSLDEFIPSSASIMSIDGHIYGVSSCTVSAAIYYNKDLFDQAGIEYPPMDPAQAWTWDEFVEKAVALTKANEDGSVDVYGAYGVENADPRMALLYAAGAQYYTDDFSACAVDTQVFRDTLNQILELRTVHKAAPQAAILDNMGISGAQMLQTGKIAMLFDGSWCLQELANMGFNVGVGCLPKMNGAEVATTLGQAHVHSAWSKTTHPDEAWKFLRFLSSEEYQTDLVKAGLWMPNRTSMYTEEGIKTWWTEEVYGAGYEAMCPFFRDAMAYQSALTPKSKTITLINDALDLFFSDEGYDMELMISELVPEVDNELSR